MTLLSTGRAVATVFAPATVGNVGPGFDVLGLAVDGLGDAVTVELTLEPAPRVSVTGRAAALVPIDADKNAAAISARAMLAGRGDARHAHVHLEKGLAVAGGMGGSAASSVGGALAAALALGRAPALHELLQASLAGESAVAGAHLDNIAPCILGGLALVRSLETMDVVSVPVHARWWVSLVTPNIRVETKAARAILPTQSTRSEWIQQMANTAGVIAAFQQGDASLLKRSLVDLYAEPRRASLIPRFREAKEAALKAGAIGCSISGSGPTLFAIAPDEQTARSCARAMCEAFAEIGASSHVGAIGQGARAL